MTVRFRWFLIHFSLDLKIFCAERTTNAYIKSKKHQHTKTKRLSLARTHNGEYISLASIEHIQMHCAHRVSWKLLEKSEKKERKIKERMKRTTKASPSEKFWHCRRTQMLCEFIRDFDKHIQWEPLRIGYMTKRAMGAHTAVTNTKTRYTYGICSKVGEIHKHSHSQRWKHIDTVLVLAVFALYIAFFGCELPSHLRTFSLGLTNKLIHKRNNFQHCVQRESRAYTEKWGYSFASHIISPPEKHSFVCCLYTFYCVPAAAAAAAAARFLLLFLLYSLHRPLACIRIFCAFHTESYYGLGVFSSLSHSLSLPSPDPILSYVYFFPFRFFFFSFLFFARVQLLCSMFW